MTAIVKRDELLSNSLIYATARLKADYKIDKDQQHRRWNIGGRVFKWLTQLTLDANVQGSLPDCFGHIEAMYTVSRSPP